MSQLLGVQSSLQNSLLKKDPYSMHNVYLVFPPVYKMQLDLVFGRNKVNKGWSRSRLQGMESDMSWLESKPFRVKVRHNGTRQQVAISGYTRDVYNTPLPFCTVKLYRTLDDSVQYVTTSDANGFYQVLSSYSDDHYIVTYKVGSPDVTGASINTLRGI